MTLLQRNEYKKYCSHIKVIDNGIYLTENSKCDLYGCVNWPRFACLECCDAHDPLNCKACKNVRIQPVIPGYRCRPSTRSQRTKMMNQQKINN